MTTTKEYPQLPTQKEIVGHLRKQGLKPALFGSNATWQIAVNYLKEQAIDLLENKDKEIERLNKLIESYKFICELADVPQILIDNPAIAKPQKLTESDIKWAKAQIELYKQDKNK